MATPCVRPELKNDLYDIQELNCTIFLINLQVNQGLHKYTTKQKTAVNFALYHVNMYICLFLPFLIVFLFL